MADQVDYIVLDSDNVITLTLEEDGAPITGSWTELDIDFGGVNINRATSENGVALSNGVLTIQPGALLPAEIAEIRALLPRTRYQVLVTVKSGIATNGLIFGADDSTNAAYFVVTDPT